MPTYFNVPVAFSAIVDRWLILRLKQRNRLISDELATELAVIKDHVKQVCCKQPTAFLRQLKTHFQWLAVAHQCLWILEDEIREMKSDSLVTASDLADLVVAANNTRGTIKNLIDHFLDDVYHPEKRRQSAEPRSYAIANPETIERQLLQLAGTIPFAAECRSLSRELEPWESEVDGQPQYQPNPATPPQVAQQPQPPVVSGAVPPQEHLQALDPGYSEGATSGNPGGVDYALLNQLLSDPAKLRELGLDKLAIGG